MVYTRPQWDSLPRLKIIQCSWFYALGGSPIFCSLSTFSRTSFPEILRKQGLSQRAARRDCPALQRFPPGRTHHHFPRVCRWCYITPAKGQPPRLKICTTHGFTPGGSPFFALFSTFFSNIFLKFCGSRDCHKRAADGLSCPPNGFRREHTTFPGFAGGVYTRPQRDSLRRGSDYVQCHGFTLGGSPIFLFSTSRTSSLKLCGSRTVTSERETVSRPPAFRRERTPPCLPVVLHHAQKAGQPPARLKYVMLMVLRARKQSIFCSFSTFFACTSSVKFCGSGTVQASKANGTVPALLASTATSGYF